MRSHSVKAPHLALRVQSPSFSRVAAGKLGFLSSCDREFWDPLVWPQERKVSMRVASGLSGFLSSRCRVLSPFLELRPDPDVSSPVLTWFGVPLESSQANQTSSRVETCTSSFLLSFSSSVRLPVELTQGSVAFSRGSRGLSQVPSCCESILAVTAESVQGKQLYLEWDGNSGSFGMVARPLRLLSRFKLRPPPLEG